MSEPYKRENYKNARATMQRTVVYCEPYETENYLN